VRNKSEVDFFGAQKVIGNYINVAIRFILSLFKVVFILARTLLI